MHDLVSIGTVALDLYFKGDSLTYENDRFQLAVGGKYFADDFYEGLGGGATNVAIGAKKNGLNVALAATIGDNVYKKVILHKLDELQVDYSLSIFEKKYYNISSILIAPTGDRSIINYRSSDIKSYETHEQRRPLLRTRMVYLANLPNLSLVERAEMLEDFKKHEVITFANIGTADCKKPFEEIREFLKHVDVLIINAHEFSEMVHTPYDRIKFDHYVKDQYLGEFKHMKLVLTDGIKGSYAYFRGEVFHQDAVKPPAVVDATGAGDAYTAGFISSYAHSHDLREAMKKGAEYSAYVVSVVGSN
jgi:fructokinase